LAHVPLPAALGIRTAGWRFDPRQQVNEAEFSTARQVVGDTGAQRWEATFQFVPIKRQDASLPLKAFQASLDGAVNSFALPAVEEAQHSGFALLAGQIGLTNVANMTITGRTATKTGGAFADDASVISAASTTSGCVLAFRPGANNRWFVLGINGDPNTNLLRSSIDYAFWCRGDGLLDVLESGTLVSLGRTYSSADLLSIVYDNSSVRYFRNGELLRTVATTAGRTFWLDSAFDQPGSSATEIAFYELLLAAAGQSTITLTGLAASSATAVRGGWRATALLLDGRAQMVTILRDAASDAFGLAAGVTFKPALLGPTYAMITDRPFCVMGLVDPATQIGIEPGQMYSAELAVREVFR
jgi:hypothetical protein